MKPKFAVKICTDLVMTILLLLLMGYEMVGQVAHEWLGIVIFALFIVHHVLNKNWIKNIFKGHYSLSRCLQTALSLAVFIAMAGSAVSGVILSRHALSFLPIHGGRSFARSLHMLSAYWGFLFLSLHLGVHVKMISGVIRKHTKYLAGAPLCLARGAAACFALYGAYAFCKREIGSYLFLKMQFVFFDFGEPFVLFFLDYTAVMALFLLLGHLLSEFAGKHTGRKMK